MAKKITPQQNATNISNANKGTSGTNKQYVQNQSNTAKQKSQPATGKKKQMYF